MWAVKWIRDNTHGVSQTAGMPTHVRPSFAFTGSTMRVNMTGSVSPMSGVMRLPAVHIGARGRNANALLRTVNLRQRLQP